MAKKYNHAKQVRSKAKGGQKKSDERPDKFILKHSPNPDENRSFPKSERFKKKAKAAADKDKERLERDSKFKSSSKPFAKNTGDKAWESRQPRDSSERTTTGRSYGKPSSGEKRSFRDKDKPDRPGWGITRDEFVPRSEEERVFRKKGDFKKRDHRKGKKGGAKENEAQSNRADKGRRPRYNEDVMKSKLSAKILDKVEKQESKHTDGTIRLNRYIANAGVCSRREADELIASGKVTVNGKVITELGSRVMPEDTVTFNGNKLERENFVYVLLNKPKDFLTTTDDPDERKTVMDIVAEAANERIYPVGRLDRKTTGLLLLTNDGKLAEKLSHPSNDIAKIYQAELDKPITEEHFDAIVAGFELEDGFIKPDELALVTPDAEVVGIKIHSGKNRIVRRIFEHFGYKVQKLDRTVYASLNKKDLPRGKWRYLSEKEVIKLKYLS